MQKTERAERKEDASEKRGSMAQRTEEGDRSLRHVTCESLSGLFIGALLLRLVTLVPFVCSLLSSYPSFSHSTRAPLLLCIVMLCFVSLFDLSFHSFFFSFPALAFSLHCVLSSLSYVCFHQTQGWRGRQGCWRLATARARERTG